MRSWPQRGLVAVNLVVLVALFGWLGWAGWIYQGVSDITRVDLPAGVLETEAKEPGEPENFLLVGSDSREFTEDDPEAVSSFGDQGYVEGQRADTIMIVRVDPRSGEASMLSLPRDLLVDAPGGGEQRINESYGGGPEQLIETVKSNFDIPIHHYVEVDFAGFKGLVDAINGVKMYFPNPVRDWKCENGRCLNPSGLHIPDPGCYTLDGDAALSFVRSRHFQERIDGEWVWDNRSDFERIERQQDFIVRAVSDAIGRDLLNPLTLTGLVSAAKEHVRPDPELRIPGDVVDLASHFRDVGPENIQRHSINVETVMGPGGAYGGERPVDGPENQATFDVFRGVADEPADEGTGGDGDGGSGSVDIEPIDVTVRVLNGSGRSGEAGSTTDAISDLGFGVTVPGDAVAPTARTIVRHGPGDAAAAEFVASFLEVEPVVEEVPAIEGADVVVITGDDHTGVRSQPRAGAVAPGGDDGTTTTTPRETTTSTLSPEQAKAVWEETIQRNNCR